jgi:prephenate dehydrogenase
MKTLGIIGFGAFGRLAASELAALFTVGVYDPAVSAAALAPLGLAALSLEAAAASDIVLIAVPVQVMEGVIMAIAPHVRPGATVIDVASVKMLPSQWLRAHIPDTTHIVAAHPLFGPQSTARHGVVGRQLVLCPIRGDRHLKVAQLGEQLGLRVRITSAEAHDQEMAYVQALTHLIGRTLARMDIPDEALKTQSYQHLLDLTGLIGTDSFDLFSAIQLLNPHAPPVVEQFVREANALLAELGRADG